MKKLFVVLMLAPVLAFAQKTGTTPKPSVPQKTQQGFTINGKLDGYSDGTEIKLIRNGEGTEMASTKLAKGKFVMKGKVDEPVLCYLLVGSQKPTELYLENGNITFKGEKSKPDVWEISGSSSHKDFKEFTKVFLPMAQQLNSLASTINNSAPGAERESLLKTHATLQQSIQTEIEKFVTQKPKSVVSPFVLSVTYDFNQDVVLLENRFKKLDASVKSTSTGRQLEQFIAEGKIGAVGTEAMDFTQPDTTGVPVSLSSFRGKYVLVDFWASWCGPCRNENPNVVENFNRFKSKNFTILGVSLDRPGQKEAWVNAIKEDNLAWSHVSDLQWWNNSAAKLYKVAGIPQNFLVDPQGKIIGRNLRGPALQEKLCEVLGCN
jgi:peroxiredoxin